MDKTDDAKSFNEARYITKYIIIAERLATYKYYQKATNRWRFKAIERFFIYTRRLATMYHSDYQRQVCNSIRCISFLIIKY